MEFVAIQNGEPTYLLSGCSDVINLGGIGGYNVFENDIEKYSTRVKSQVVPVNDWNIDCLPVSGLPRLFCHRKMIVGASISNFEVYFIPTSSVNFNLFTNDANFLSFKLEI